MPLGAVGILGTCCLKEGGKKKIIVASLFSHQLVHSFRFLNLPPSLPPYAP